jgi:hypothetical protein
LRAHAQAAGEIVGVPADGEGHVDAALGEIVDDRPLLGHADGMVQGHDDAPGADADALGRLR